MNKSDKNKKAAWQQLIGIVFMVLTGAVCGLIMVRFLSGSDKEASLGILAYAEIFIGLYATLIFHSLVHEAGHLVFGLLTGYGFCSFRIFSFMWVKDGEKLKLRRLSLAGTGGQCLMSPPDIKDGKMPFVLYNLGGSIMNAAVGALFLALYFICPNGSRTAPFVLLFAAVGFITAVMNGVPMRLGAVDNDGYNALAISKSSEAAEAFWVQLSIVGQSARGVRLKDMPEEWFRVPAEESMQNSIVAVRGVLACNRLMDEQKFNQADALMARMLAAESGMAGIHRGLLVCDRIYIELIGVARREAIEAMLTKAQAKFMKSMRRYPSVLRTEYALALLLEKNAARAEGIRAEFEKAAKSYPYPQETESEQQLICLALNKSRGRT